MSGVCMGSATWGGRVARRGGGALAAMLLACVLAVLALPQAAYADFTISVGYDYDGAGVYEKAVFSDEDMQAMSDGVTYEYATFDSGEFLRKGFGIGVELETLYRAADVTTSEIKWFEFITEDSYTASDVQVWYYSELFQTTRYYYPDYITYYNFNTGAIPNSAIAAIEASKVVVPTMIAYTSSFQRVSSADDYAWYDSSLMSDSAGYRLMYGSATIGDYDSRGFANRLEGFIVRLDGSPEIVFDTDEVSGEVGSEVTLTASIVAEDEAIEQGGLANLTWESSDESVLEIVDDDGAGTITVRILGEGSVSITASFDGISASVGGTGLAVQGTDDDDDGGDADDDDGEDEVDDEDDEVVGETDGTGSGEGDEGDASGEGEGGAIDSTTSGSGSEQDALSTLTSGSVSSNAAATSTSEETTLAAEQRASDEAVEDVEQVDTADESAVEEAADVADETIVEEAAVAADESIGSGGGADEGSALSKLLLNSDAIEVSVTAPWRIVVALVVLLIIGFAVRVGVFLRARDPYARLRAGV